MDIKLVGDKTKDLGVGIAYLKESTDDRELWGYTKDSEEVLTIMADASKEFIVVESVKDAVEQLELTNRAPEGFTRVNGVSFRAYENPEFSRVDRNFVEETQGATISVITDNTVMCLGTKDWREEKANIDIEDIFDKARQYDRIYLDPSLINCLLKKKEPRYSSYSANFVELCEEDFVVKTFCTKTNNTRHRNTFAYLEYNPKRAKALTTRRKNLKVKNNPWYMDYEKTECVRNIEDVVETIIFQQYPILQENINLRQCKATKHCNTSATDHNKSNFMCWQKNAWTHLEIAVGLRCTIALRKSKELKKNIKEWFKLLDSAEFHKVPDYIIWDFIARIQDIFKWKPKRLPAIYNRYLEEKAIADKLNEEEAKRIAAEEAKVNAELAAAKEETVEHVTSEDK